MMPNQPGVSSPIKDEHPALARETLAAGALARRHVLLKGLGKAGAAAAAFVPIHTLAQSTSTILVTTDNTLCTQSGQASNVMSRTIPKVTCSGYSPAHYAPDTTPWPLLDFKFADKNSLRFNDLFAQSTSTTKVRDILKTAGTSDQAYWIAANFNARQQIALNFPYTLSEVIAQYNEYAAGKPELLSLYRNFLSSLV